MRGEVLVEPRVTGERGDEVLHVVGRHASPGGVKQQRLLGAAVDGCLDGLHRRWCESHDGGLVALGGAQRQGVVPGVAADVDDVAGNQFTATKSVRGARRVSDRTLLFSVDRQI